MAMENNYEDDYPSCQILPEKDLFTSHRQHGPAFHVTFPRHVG